jgi:sulfite exporter TauE/SafE
MRFTRARDLVVIGLISVAVVNLLVRLTYGSLPPLPTFAGITLFALAVLEVGLATMIRSKIRHPGAGRPLQPLTAARSVALAKASSVLGALMVGAWIGVLIYVVPRQGYMQAAADDMASAIIGAVSAATLIAAALWLENSCRTPEEDDDDQRKHPE